MIRLLALIISACKRMLAKLKNEGLVENCQLPTSYNRPSAKIDVPAGALTAGVCKANLPVRSCPAPTLAGFQPSPWPNVACNYKPHKAQERVQGRKTINHERQCRTRQNPPRPAAPRG